MFSYLKTKFSRPQPVELPPPTAYEDPTVPLPTPQAPPRSPLLDQITDRTKKLIPKVSLKNILPSRRPVRGETPSLEGFSYGRDSNDAVPVSPPPTAASPPSGHADSPTMIGHRTPPPITPPSPPLPPARSVSSQRISPPSSASSRDLPSLPTSTPHRSLHRDSSQEVTPPPTIPSFSTNRRYPPSREASLETPPPTILPSTSNRRSLPRDSSLDEIPQPFVISSDAILPSRPRDSPIEELERPSILPRSSPPSDSYLVETPSPTKLPSTTTRPSLPRESSSSGTPSPTILPPFAKIRETVLSKSSLVNTPPPTVIPDPRKISSPPRSLVETPPDLVEVVTPTTRRRVQSFSLTEEIKKQQISDVEELPRQAPMPVVPRPTVLRQASPPEEPPTRVVQPMVVRKISPAIKISEVVHEEEQEEPEIESPPSIKSLPDLGDYIKVAESDSDSEPLPLPLPTLQKKEPEVQPQVPVRSAWHPTAPRTLVEVKEVVEEKMYKEEEEVEKQEENVPDLPGPFTSQPVKKPNDIPVRSLPALSSAALAEYLKKGKVERELPTPAVKNPVEQQPEEKKEIVSTEEQAKPLRRTSTIVYPNLHHFDDIGKEKEHVEVTKEIYIEERKSFRRTRRHVLEAALKQASEDREAQGILETAALKSVTHAIAFQVALNLIALTMQGFLSGLAVAHAVFAYVFADRDLLLKGYRWMSLPVHATFMVCFILGIMASVDRVRWHEFSLKQFRSWINAFGGLLQLIPMLIGLAASEMSLYFDEAMAPVIRAPVLDQNSINTWKIFSTVRAGCAVFSWISVAFQPTNTAILEHIGMFMLPEDAREAHDYYKEAGAPNLVESRIPAVFGGVMDQVTKNMMSNMGVNSVPTVSVLLKNATVLSSNPTDLPQSIPPS